MRILVTGVSGPFGAHFAKACLDRGNGVVSIAHSEREVDSASLLGIRNQIKWTVGDVRDAEDVRCALDGVDAVAHFAAVPLVRLSGPLQIHSVFNHNALGTASVLEAIYKVGGHIKFLFCSTDKVYGTPQPEASAWHGYVERDPLNGTGAYEASKIAAEAVCRAYASHRQVPNLVVTRVCNIIAPSDTNRRLVNSTVWRGLTGKPLEVYDQSFVREYIHVDDAVEAQLTLLERADEFGDKTFNIGSGERYTQAEIVQMIRDDFFPEAEITTVKTPPRDRKEQDFPSMYCGKITRNIGWKSKRTVKDALAETVAFWRDRMHIVNQILGTL